MFRVIGTLSVVAGTRVQLTSGQTNPALPVFCQAVYVEALPANTGAVKVGDSALVASSDVGVAASLLKCAATGPVSAKEFRASGVQNGLNLGDFYIDGANSGDKVYVSIVGT